MSDGAITSAVISGVFSVLLLISFPRTECGWWLYLAAALIFGLYAVTSTVLRWAAMKALGR